MRSQSSGSSAYAALINSIREGVFAPGDRLREEDVGERLGLSRTPVREAFRRLEAEGIIEHRPRHGAVVRQLQHTEIIELYEMRAVLERTAAEMAAKHGSAAEFDNLEDLNNQIAAERDNPNLGAAINQDFHRGLYLSARNRFLLASARELNNSLLLLGPTTYTDPDRIDVVATEHAAIVAALKAGDASEAGKAAAAHLATSLRHRLRTLGA